MNIIQSFTYFFSSLGQVITDPVSILLLFGSVMMGIIFGALPGLTATLGVALLTTLTYGMQLSHALVSLMGIYVGAVYGGSYGSIMINIPGTASAAATALEGYPLSKRGLAGKALGLTTTASAIGTVVGMFFVVIFTPLITKLSLQFTSFEFFLLAFFGIMISGSISCPDTPQKGWLCGFFGLFLAMIGRDQLQTYPRFTFGITSLESGLETVPVLIGAFGIPQIIQVLSDNRAMPKQNKIDRVLPSWKAIGRNIKHIVRSALIGVGIGAVPGIGEDIAAWVSYGTAKKTSKHPEEFGNGSEEGIIASETANNSCIGGAMIPLLSMGIPGSPPAAMLLGALLLHGIAPGPMLEVERPGFTLTVSAILLLASISMWIIGILLAKQVSKILKVPSQLLMPIVGVLCIIGSYALGLKAINLYLMVPMGIITYLITERGYPIPPLVIGVILGNMADANLRRGLMVSKGSLLPFIQRPVCLILVIIIIFTFLSGTSFFKNFLSKLKGKIIK
ncbi:MAG: tripartite tricarboxylate transporter permease [Spirochaetales bacterium]|nr:tripartite tricarboxylate transporter permease [Spirochaetales bacterium]